MIRELATIHVSFPMLRVKSTIVHFTPRNLTAFERALLMCHRRLAAHPEYGTQPLDRLLREYLCVDLPDEFARPALDALLVAGVLRGRSVDALSKIALRDLERADNADELLASGVLPAARQEHQVEHVYDCVLGKLVRGRTVAMPEKLRVAPEPFLDSRPEREIAESIPTEALPWWRPSTKVERVRIDEPPRVQWRHVSGAICISSDGRLSIDFKEAGYTRYVATLPAEQVFADFVLSQAGDDWDELPIAGVEELVTASSVFFAQHLSARIAWRRGLHVVRPIQDFMKPPDPPPGALIIVLGDRTAPREGRLAWNAQRSGATLTLPQTLASDSAVYSDGRRVLTISRFPVRMGGKEFGLPLGVESESVPEVIRALLGDAHRRFIESRDADETVLAAAIRPAAEVLETVMARAAGEARSMADAVSAVVSFRNRLATFAGSEVQLSADALVALARECVLRMPVSPATSYLEGVRQIMSLRPRDATGLADAIDGRLAPPGNTAEYLQTANLLQLLNRPLAFAPKRCPRPVIRQILDLYRTTRLREVMAGRNEFEKALIAVKDGEEPLAKVLGYAKGFPRSITCPYVFVNPDSGKRWHEPELSKVWYATLKKAGVKGFRFHDMRHTFASRLVQAGVSLKTVAQLLGHASVVVTERYSHLAPSNLESAVEVLATKGSGKVLTYSRRKRPPVRAF